MIATLLRRGGVGVFACAEQGSALLEAALVTPFLLLMLVGAVDFGRGYYVSIEVASAAQSGALYGVPNSTNVSGMQNAAILDASDVPNIAATASYGCECSDGSSPVTNCVSAPVGCSGITVSYVEVNTSATYTPILSYPGMPSSLVLKGRSRLRSSY